MNIRLIGMNRKYSYNEMIDIEKHRVECKHIWARDSFTVSLYILHSLLRKESRSLSVGSEKGWKFLTAVAGIIQTYISTS